ncbi:hypothetical protein LY78DRAFT_214024 [Colletotrichum sublineola]|nr:hypothetical protein LY78DRAFT_214024 [Colletotrichum sublineola]
MELKGIDSNERAGRRKLRGYPAGPQSSNCNVVVDRAQRKVDEYREKIALRIPFGDNGDLGGVGVGSNTAAAQLLGGGLAEELQSFWGAGDSKGNKQKKDRPGRQVRSGQVRSDQINQFSGKREREENKWNGPSSCAPHVPPSSAFGEARRSRRHQ